MRRVANTHALRESIHKQLGVTVQQLFSRAAGLPFCLLVLENLSLELTGDAPVAADNDIRSVLQSFLDYCPSLHIVLTARYSPPWAAPLVELRALELPDVRTYVQHHATGGDSLTDVETIEILHRRSADCQCILIACLNHCAMWGEKSWQDSNWIRQVTLTRTCHTL